MEFELLKKALVQVLNVHPSEIHMDTTIVSDLGADSLDVYQIVYILEEELGVQFEPEEVEKVVTVWQAVELIKKYRGQQE